VLAAAAAAVATMGVVGALKERVRFRAGTPSGAPKTASSPLKLLFPLPPTLLTAVVPPPTLLLPEDVGLLLLLLDAAAAAAVVGTGARGGAWALPRFIAERGL